MSSKLAKLIAVALAIAAVLRVHLTRRRIAEQSAPSRDDATRAELYEEARRRGVRGRSKMTKAQLKSALSEGERG